LVQLLSLRGFISEVIHNYDTIFTRSQVTTACIIHVPQGLKGSGEVTGSVPSIAGIFPGPVAESTQPSIPPWVGKIGIVRVN